MMEATKRENEGEGGSNDKALQTKYPNLPQEMITEIFLRSPARSLGRFRCVSKPFCSLLSDPKFARKHVDHNAVRFGHRRLILSLHNLYAVDFDSIFNGCGGIMDLTAVELDYPLKEDEDSLSVLRPEAQWKFGLNHGDFTNITKRVNILGASNGLVCITLSSVNVFLYNPTTLESKRLPDLLDQSRSHAYGFGFDSLTNDYKVVKLFNGQDNYVYSLKADSWRRICDKPYEGVHFKSSVELKGAIHWVSILSGEENKKVVTAFDLNTEKFRLMPLPKCEYIAGIYKVGTLKGCLSVAHWCIKLDYVIWVMNEYSLESSWSKIRISIYCSSMIPLIPVFLTKNEEQVLLVVDGHLVLYNFQHSTWRNLKIRGVEFGKFLQANTYVESLISPNSYGKR